MLVPEVKGMRQFPVQRQGECGDIRLRLEWSADGFGISPSGRNVKGMCSVDYVSTESGYAAMSKEHGLRVYGHDSKESAIAHLECLLYDKLCRDEPESGVKEENAERWFVLIEGAEGTGKSTFAKHFMTGEPHGSTVTAFVSSGTASVEQRNLSTLCVDAVTRGLNVVLEAQEGADLTGYISIAQAACDQAGYRMVRMHTYGAE